MTAPTGQPPTAKDAMTLDDVRAVASAIKGEVAKAVVGQEETVDHLLIALMSQGDFWEPTR